METIVKLQGIGIIVKDIEKTAALFKKLFGLSDEEIQILPPPGSETEIRFAFMRAGGIDMELIQPIS